ncbi:MAG: glycosyl transferase [Clostridia bacterium]|nr:glycosyl transferase [Clostridia bacterium]
MIPKKLHACWFGGKPIPDDAQKYLESWKRFCPDYEIIIWNEENFDVNSNTYVKEAYQSKKFAFVTDYVRLKVLYEYGGIYMDTDVEVLKPLDDLLKYPAFSGFEGPNRIPTGTMGAEPNNRWIKMLLDYYDDRHFVLPDGNLDLTTNVKTITDITVSNYPIVLNNTFQSFEDFVMFPFDYLCAKDLVDGKVKTSDNTYTIHHFAGSWTSRKEKFVKWMISTFGYRFVHFLVEIKHKLFR